jgi:hypothetical protein
MCTPRAALARYRQGAAELYPEKVYKIGRYQQNPYKPLELGKTLKESFSMG